jgi:arsenate reductase
MPRGGGHMTSARREFAILLGLAVASLQVGAHHAHAQTPAASRPTQVLFMCPHGAAKSVLASTYFAQLAKDRGLRVRVETAGTDPDPAVSPVVKDHLTRQGYAVPAAAPRQVTARDLDEADVVVSLGCDVSRLPSVPGARVRQWDVPGPGEHLEEADAAIRAHVAALVDELARQVR